MIYIKIFFIFNLVIQNALTHVEPFEKGSSYSSQIEYTHPSKGPLAASINTVDGKLDSINEDFSIFMATDSFSYQSIDGSYNAKLLKDGRFFVRSIASSDGDKRDFVVLKNQEKCWVLRKMDNQLTPFEYTSISCDAMPSEETVPEISYAHPVKGIGHLFFAGHGQVKSIFDTGETISASFTFRDLDDQPVNAAINEDSLKFNVRKPSNTPFVAEHDFINLPNGSGDCFQVRLTKTLGELQFKRMKIRCDYSVVGMEKRNGKEIADIHTSTLYTNTSDAIHRIQLARLLGQMKLSGHGILVGIFDNGFRINGNPTIVDKAVGGGLLEEGGTIDENYHDIVYNGVLGDHGSNQARVLLGKAYNKRIGVAPSTLFMPIVGLGTVRSANQVQSDTGIRFFSMSLVDVSFSSIFRNGDNSPEDMLFVIIAGNGMGQESKLAEGFADEHGDLSPIIITVAVDERGNLTKKSSRCGKTKPICLAVPALELSSPTAPTVIGVAALLQQAFPTANSRQIRTALLEGVTQLPDSELTGVGMLNGYKAYLRLKELLNL
jgi:hypothetical protein